MLPQLIEARYETAFNLLRLRHQTNMFRRDIQSEEGAPNWSLVLRHELYVIDISKVDHVLELQLVKAKQKAFGQEGRRFGPLWYSMTQPASAVVFTPLTKAVNQQIQTRK